MKTVTLSAQGRYIVLTFPPSDADVADVLRATPRIHWKPGLGGWVTEVKDVMGLVAHLRTQGLQVRFGAPVQPERPRVRVVPPAPKSATREIPVDGERLKGLYFTPSQVSSPQFQEAYVARWRTGAESLPTLEPVDLGRLDTSFDVPGFRGDLYPFQRQAVAFLRELGWSGIVADEMGLGKTVEALAAALLAGERTLVVTPASVKYNWLSEIRRFTDRGARVVNGPYVEGPPDAFFTVVNYDVLPRHVDRLNAEGFGLVVLDEAHFIKNPRTRRAQAAFRLEIPRRILLTGTPLLNRPMELFPLLDFAQPGKWGTERAFDHHFNRRVTRLDERGLVVAGAAAEHLADLKERLRGVMIRRQKDAVLRDLPAKTIEVQPIPLPPEAERAYRAMEDELADYLRESGLETAFRPHNWLRTLARMHQLKQFTLAQRLPRAVEWLRARAADGEKVVVFSQYLAPLHELAERFRGESILIDGSVGSRERLARVDRFQAEPDVKFAFGQIQAMGIGLNLTAARHVLFLDLAWTPAAHAQAMDRCHRIGQRRPVVVTFLVTPGTIDDPLQRILLEKQAVINTVMGERQRILTESAVARMVADALIRAHA